MKIILASQSPYRRRQLQDFGMRFEAHAPLADESELKKTGPQDLTELTRYLAQAKALSLVADFPHDLILGSDQLAEIDGARLDKPGTAEAAAAQLNRLSGREHRLITSLALVRGERVEIFTDVTRIRFRELTPRRIAKYLEVDQPLDCAGSYKIEKAGLSLIETLETADPSAIQGLPLLSLARGLESFNLNLEDYWERK